MLDTFLKRAGWFVLLLLLQALVFNHIHILGYATPMVTVYLTLLFPSTASRSSVLVWSFALGLATDTFANTPGIAAFSMTFVGLLQPYLLALYSTRDDANEVLVPSFGTMGWAAFVRYVATGVIIYEILFFALESFSLFNWKILLLNIASSSVLSILFILAFESIRGRGKQRGQRHAR